jgi:hypothetical protein
MTANIRQTVGAVTLSLLALACAVATSQAQCRNAQIQNVSRLQNVIQQQQLQQLLQTQQLNTLIALQQQSGLIGLQQLPQSRLLNALRQQLQQNGLLIALDNKLTNSSKPPRSQTAAANQRFLTLVQSASQQTQELLTVLALQTGISNQDAWQNALQQQLSLLTSLSQRYSEQPSR